MSTVQPDAYGQRAELTSVDRLGVWLSARRLLKEAGGLDQKRIGDFGCGFDATFVRAILPRTAHAVLVDVARVPDLQGNPRITAIEGLLPGAISGIESASLDVAMCVSVLEHLTDPMSTIIELRRVVRPGGAVLLNVPTWLGKRFLELSAFRLGLSPPESIDDHKRYFDPKDLWPLLVAADFRPRDIRCFRHKFGLNTFATCRVPGSAPTSGSPVEPSVARPICKTASMDLRLARSYHVVGGAGFIGSHIVDALLASDVDRVTVFDSFVSGRRWHIEHHLDDPRFDLVDGDVCNAELLTESMAGHEVVIHLASNPDIARAATEPAIDFDAGTLLTHHVVESVRQAGVPELLYASGSGVYGEIGDREAQEDFGPLIPISTYAASKLAGEAVIAAYCYMFDLRGRAFRFGNVVGPRQTHGVGFDFVRRLHADPSRLVILGDGTQSKSYVYIDDIVRSLFTASAHETLPYNVYNVATGDYITVTEIAEIAVDCLGLDRSLVSFEYTGGDRGWKGDVPVVRLNSDRIRGLGWECESSAALAIRRSITSMIDDEVAGRL